MTFKGKPVDAKAIGKDLGVRYVLEGSVLPSGDQVRVNAQLIDADSGAHLWADQFDTPRADLLQTQDEIVTHLAHAMDIQLPEAEATRLKRRPAANLDAEDLALRCEADVQKGGDIGKDADAGSRLCEQALAADTSNVRALTWLAVKIFYSAAALARYDPWYYGEATGHFGLKQYDQTIELARRAIAISPSANPWMHLNLIAALALAGHEAEAHDALQNYVASVPSWPKTIAAWKAAAAPYISARSNPRYLETLTGITTACPRRGCRRNKAQRGRRRSHPARRADQSQSSHARRPPPLSSAPQTSASYSDVQPSQALDQRAISPHHCLSCPRKRASSRDLPRP